MMLRTCADDRMYRRAVRFLTAADSGIDTHMAYGMMHRAVSFFVEAGASAADGHAAATSVSAPVCGVKDRKGLLCKGYGADIIAVNGVSWPLSLPGPTFVRSFSSAPSFAETPDMAGAPLRAALSAGRLATGRDRGGTGIAPRSDTWRRRLLFAAMNVGRGEVHTHRAKVTPERICWRFLKQIGTIAGDAERRHAELGADGVRVGWNGGRGRRPANRRAVCKPVGERLRSGDDDCAVARPADNGDRR